MKILVTDKADFTFETPADAEVVYFKESRPIPPEHLDAEVVIAWGHNNSLGDYKKMGNLKWVQSLSAGTDAFISHGLPENTILTSGRGLHDHTVSEHTVTLLLALIRQIPELVRAQEEHFWDGVKGMPRALKDPERVSSIIDANVLIWGFGSIGQALAPILTSLQANVKGVAQTEGERAGYPVISPDQLPEELPNTDVLVMILPSLPSTDKALNAELISLLPNRAIVCNVGRGSTVDEDALLDALQNGELSGAALDVTNVEPLPADSPLWDAPNLLLTPHIAGYRAHGAETLIADNLAAYLANEALTNQVEH